MFKKRYTEKIKQWKIFFIKLPYVFLAKMKELYKQ